MCGSLFKRTTTKSSTFHITALAIVQRKRDRFLRGELLRTDDCYFITALTFETKSEGYSWLNGFQAVGKMLELKGSEGAHLMYDIFVIR